MNGEPKLTKAQEPWIGPRGRIGVVIPSTNIGVEYDCQKFITPGVTWHTGRFWVEFIDLSSDQAFLAFIDGIRETIPDAVRDVLTAEVSYIMMGMSAETFWGGLAGNEEFETKLRDQTGPDMGLTTGATAVDAALKAFGANNVSVLTPYQSVADEEVHRFFTESGYNVVNVVGMKCDTANTIAHTPQGDVIDVVLNQLDGDDVDAIVQVGTNMSNADLFPVLEKHLNKPVIPINVASIWHAYRAIGVADKFIGQGWLFERF
ncbi:MAG: Asp/Glu racemase [Alphaproteobacteria bacterium]|nr:Asp/Glu racemase [Alphaproteobacteria bacterium]